MKEEPVEKALLKHYRNIHKLSHQQLDALKEGNLADISQYIAQKQLIIDQIAEVLPAPDMAGLREDEVEVLRQLITDIAAQEDESRQLLSKYQEAVREKIVASQKEKVLRQAYDAPLSSGFIVDRSE